VTALAATATAGRVDWGRALLVPVFSLLLIANVLAMARMAQRSHGPAAAVGMLVSALTVTFYVAVIAAYLRRGAASATTAQLPARAAAVVATSLPMVLPFAAGAREDSLGRDIVATMLIVLGLAGSVWSLRALGTNLSVIAQVRGLAATGPYRWVRHPLYVAEILTVLGIVLRSPSLVVLALWALLVLLQAYRAVVEERLLTSAQPDYAEYTRRTARFVPRIF
jgi:protein-S-isoprenylcysteine O-methyltransferase Ste14